MGQKRYYQVLLFRRDLETIINLFVSSCEDVEILIDNVPVMPLEGCFPFENRRIRSFCIKGYGDLNTVPQTNEERPSVQLKITPLSAVVAISEKPPRSLWEVELKTRKLLSSSSQITLLTLLIRMACFTILGNEAILAYVLQTSQTFIHIVIDILLVALWLAFGVWGLRASNRLTLVNLDTYSIAGKRKWEGMLKTIFVVIGAVFIAALVMWLKGLAIS